MEVNRSKVFTDIKLISSRKFNDERGFFYESYRKMQYWFFPDFVQENCSYSIKNVFRGLHYQLNPKAQDKLISCISGSIVDYVVDIRKDSPTFGKWDSFDLKDDCKALYIPKGFAHGFLALEPSKVIYKVSEFYSPDHEEAIRWNDPDIGIVDDIKLRLGASFYPLLSDKDAKAPLLKNANHNFFI